VVAKSRMRRRRRPRLRPAPEGERVPMKADADSRYISREAITSADQRRVLGVLAGASRRRRSPRNNRSLTPRRGNDSQNFITAEPCVAKTPTISWS
jgi:hypothetical protein